MNIIKSVKKNIFISIAICALLLTVLLPNNIVFGQNQTVDVVPPSEFLDNEEIPDWAVPFTQEELNAINNLPSTHLGNLTFDNSEFKPGDIVKGSFFIRNQRDYNINLNYSILLSYGDIDGEPVGYLDEKTNKLMLNSNESKYINFEYRIPEKVFGDNFKINVNVYTEAGHLLSWVDQEIEMESQGDVVEINNAYIYTDSANVGLQEGVILSNDRQGSLNFEIVNPAGNLIGVVLDFEIYPKSISSGNLYKNYTKSVTLDQGVNKFSIPIDINNDKPEVYEGLLKIKNEVGDVISPRIYFRYIVEGDLVTIHNSRLVLPNSADENNFTITKDSNFKIGISYSGNAYDILSNETRATQGHRTEIIIRNENNEIVGQETLSLDYSTGLYKEIDFIAKDSAGNLYLNINVFNSNDVLILNHQNIFYGNKLISEDNDWLNKNILFALVGILILVLVIFLVRKLGVKNTVTSFVILSIFSLSNSESVFAAQVERDTAQAVMMPGSYTAFGLDQSISINAPFTVMEPGESFDLSGSLTAFSCSNAADDAAIRATAILNKNNPSNIVNTMSQVRGGFLRPYWDDIVVSGQNDYVSRGFGLRGPYVAPDEPGQYRIYLTVDLTRRDGVNGDAGRTAYYIDFEVIPTDPINGECNDTTTSQSYLSLPANYAQLGCTSGIPSNLRNPSYVGGSYIWDCLEQYGGVSEFNCTTQPVAPIPGQCGSADGKYYPAQSNINLSNRCANGTTPTTITSNGDGTFGWDCQGLYYPPAATRVDRQCDTILNPIVSDASLSCVFQFPGDPRDITLPSNITAKSFVINDDGELDPAGFEYKFVKDDESPNEGEVLIFEPDNGLIPISGNYDLWRASDSLNFNLNKPGVYQVKAYLKYFGQTNVASEICDGNFGKSVVTLNIPEIIFSIDPELANDENECIAQVEIPSRDDQNNETEPITCEIATESGDFVTNLGLSNGDEEDIDVTAGTAYRLKCRIVDPLYGDEITDSGVFDTRLNSPLDRCVVNPDFRQN